MRSLYTLALLAVGFCAVASSVHAQESTEGWEVEQLLTPVRFDTLAVEGRGANAVLTFSYTARMAGNVTFRLLTTDEKKPDQSPQPIEIVRRLREGESGTERVSMRLIPNRDYTLMVTAEENTGSATATRHVALRSVGSEIQLVDLWATPLTSESIEVRAARGGELPDTGSPDRASRAAGISESSVAASSATRTVRIRGKLQTPLYARTGSETKGVYGMDVWLFFRRPGAPFVKAELVRHSGTTTQGVHYDVLDEEGNFSFEFQTNDNLALYSEVAIVPSLLGSTAAITNGPSSNIAYYDPYTGGYEDFLTPTFGGVTIPIPSSGSIDVYQEGVVDRGYGPVFRYMEFAKELAFREYGGSPPFSLPFAGVEMIPREGSGIMNYLTGGINIFLGGNTASTITHEYGHYVMYNMYGQNSTRYALRNLNLREGWAIFYSWATRAYVAETYGDVQLSLDNVENGAYSSYGTRYSGIYGTKYDYAGIGALLWSLYDGRSFSAFEYARGDEFETLLGDNDDLNGYRRDVWESVRTTGASVFNESGIAEVTATFRARLPTAVQPSVDDAFAFFLCPGFPDGCSAASLQNMPSRRPRAVQVSDLMGRAVTSGTAELNWNRNTYAPYSVTGLA